jgi:hypothetical protein
MRYPNRPHAIQFVIRNHDPPNQEVYKMETNEVPVYAGAPLHDSTVGNVIDVATPATGKLKALGLIWGLCALGPIVVLNYLVINALTSDSPMLSAQHPLEIAGAALMPFVAWFALGSAIQRFSASSSEERHFRSGPGGISVCLPNDGAKATFCFSLKTWKFDLRWDQIKTWYPYVHSINGVPTERSIIFETIKGEKISIKTYHFAEKQKQIANNIAKARLILTPASEPTRASDNSGHETATEATSLPPGIGELSIRIGKKKDPVKEIDLSTVPWGERVRCFETIADLLEAKLVHLCPLAAGFKCSRKRYRPINGRKDVMGIRTYLRRGLLEGYEIQLEPNDADYRKLTVSISASSLVSDIRKYITIVIGVGFLLFSLKWLPVIQHSLGQFAQLTPLVLLALILAVMGVCAGLLQVPISLARLLGTHKQREEIQKQGLKSGIAEVAF